MRVIGMIPARWASTRLPGKPLLDLGGKPILEHVWRQARQAASLTRLLVATDDRRIYQAVQAFGGDAVMTSRHCASGTDRLAQVAAKISCELIVNIQGDEPFLPPAYLEKLIAPFRTNPKLEMATLCAPLPQSEAQDPNAVKVVCDLAGYALYFSRAPIPYVRDQVPKKRGLSPCLHLGLYAFRRRTLLRLTQWPPTPLEKTEKLEQLRALEHGVRIKVVSVARPILSIDTPADLKQARKRMAAKQCA